MTADSDVMSWQAAVRMLCARRVARDYADAERRYAHVLTFVQCNMVTIESVERAIRGSVAS